MRQSSFLPLWTNGARAVAAFLIWPALMRPSLHLPTCRGAALVREHIWELGERGRVALTCTAGRKPFWRIRVSVLPTLFCFSPRALQGLEHAGCLQPLVFPVFIPVSEMLTYCMPWIPALTHQEKGPRADAWESWSLSCPFLSQAGDIDNSLILSFIHFPPFSHLFPRLSVLSLTI